MQVPCNQRVGATGFEPTTFWTQTRRATRLRYAPLMAQIIIQSLTYSTMFETDF